MLLAEAEQDLEIARWKQLAPVVDEALKQITGKVLSGFRPWNGWWTSEDGEKWRKANRE